MSVLKYGETAGREVSKRILEPVADEATLALLSSTQCAHLATIRVGAAQWYYDKDSAAAGSAGSVVLPADGVGRFLIDNPLGDVPAARLVTAGAGMTGGGALSSDITLNVTANADASIVVNANDIQVGVLASDAQHGVRGGGTQHANAVAGGAAGFLTGADKTKLDAVQSFDAVLVAGTVTKATGIVVTASTRVVGVIPTVRGGTFPAGGFESLTAGNVVGGAGVGAVTITARKADGTLENACTDTVSVLLAG